jgi:endonuclease/exonuclease/phosphatase family metal-dependent hydrolase
LSNGQTVFKRQPPIDTTIYTIISSSPYQRLSPIFVTYIRVLIWVLLWTILAGQALASDSFRIVSQNMHRLFDDVDNGKKYEVVLPTKKFHKKTTLAAQLIHRIQKTSGVQYKAVLKEGNDLSGMDIGFLIKSEYQVKSVKQLFKKSTLAHGNSPLFSRPPLLILVCKQINCVAVLNLHLRSMIGIRSKSKGHRVRTKRLQQASAVASWIAQYQRNYSGQSLMVIGDLNALSPPDGYIDVVGTIMGKPDNRNTELSSQDLIQNDLIDLTQRIPHKERYSYIYRKKKQIIDYMLINQQFKPRLKRIWFSEIDYPFSDHAGLIADFSW